MKMISTVIKKWIAPLAILALTLTNTSTLAQEKCLSHILDMQKREEDPGYRNSRERLNRQLKNYLSSNPQARHESTITIPVVFQIIHNGDAIGSNENLSDALLQAQLDQLNADFARTNSDAGNTPAAFQGVAANTMIQFCLASVDPDGNATSGIVRTELALDQNACWNSTFISDSIVNKRAWNTTKYLNIFSVLKIAASDCSNNDILGYATFPGGNANLDVAVHAYYTIGSLSMPNPAGGSYSMGRTVTHEVGHWLMLEHIWYSDGCGTDDGVADTPEQDKSTSGCPATFPLTDACTGSGNGIMYMNYMDYVNDNCMNMFTADQGARMRAAITGSRPGLSNAQCGGGTCTPPTVSAPTVTQPTCATPTGTIVVNATGSGSLEYSVDNGANYHASSNFSGLAAGNYTIKVRLQSDQNCTATYDQNPVVLNAASGCCTPPAVSAPAVTQPTCAAPSGTIVVNATGNGPLEYSVDNGTNYQASSTFLGLAAGNYTIKVRLQSDQNCTTTYDQNPVVLSTPTGCGGENCNDYASADVPKTIPTEGTVTSTVVVSATGSITNINIKNLMGTHGYMEDLTVTLTSPANTSVILWSAICSTSSVGFKINLDDDAPNMINCPLNDGAMEKPANPLSAFNGESPTGTWTLTITDATAPDGGTLTAWTLEVCTDGGGGDCPTSRAVDDTPIVAGTYQAGTQLTSMGSVAAGSTVAFRSGDTVELKPNFAVEGNAIFEIKIQGCP